MDSIVFFPHMKCISNFIISIQVKKKCNEYSSINWHFMLLFAQMSDVGFEFIGKMCHYQDFSFIQYHMYNVFTITLSSVNFQHIFLIKCVYLTTLETTFSIYHVSGCECVCVCVGLYVKKIWKINGGSIYFKAKTITIINSKEYTHDIFCNLFCLLLSFFCGVLHHFPHTIRCLYISLSFLTKTNTKLRNFDK